MGKRRGFWSGFLRINAVVFAFLLIAFVIVTWTIPRQNNPSGFQMDLLIGSGYMVLVSGMVLALVKTVGRLEKKLIAYRKGVLDEQHMLEEDVVLTKLDSRNQVAAVLTIILTVLTELILAAVLVVFGTRLASGLVLEDFDSAQIVFVFVAAVLLLSGALTIVFAIRSLTLKGYVHETK